MGTAEQDEEYRLHQKSVKPEPACPTAEKFLLAWAEMAGVGVGDGIDTSQTPTLRGALS